MKMKRSLGWDWRRIIGHPEHTDPGSSQEAQTSQQSLTAPPPVQSAANSTFSPPLAAEAGTAQLTQTAQRMVVEQPGIEPVPAPTDPQSNEVGPSTFLTSPASIVRYQDAVMFKNKVMARFEKRPEIYFKFLEILQELSRMNQEGQRTEGQKQALESLEILFENDLDLVQEFKQQLRSSGSAGSQPSSCAAADSSAKTRAQKNGDRSALVISPQPVCVPKVQNQTGISPGKRSAAIHLGSGSTAKRARLSGTNVLAYDTDTEEAAKYGTVEDYLFFDKVRKALIEDGVYENFLRCLALYNQSIISKNELVELLKPFIGRFTLLMQHIKELLGLSDAHCYGQQNEEKQRRQQVYEADGSSQKSELEHKIDFATCRKLGVSYRSLPDSYVRPVCAGRTPLCDSVLNDTWVSFPCWSSEDSSSVHSKKTQYEEFVFRTEDERYELDIVIEVNKSALEVLEMVQRKMSRMKKDELNNFRLDSALGGTSPSIMLRALKRIYGDHTQKMLEGAMKNPQVMVPRLIERMRQKDVEWRKNQEICNRIWREETEKHYAKSLDHQAQGFKQNDAKLLRPRTIVSQFENFYDERVDRIEEDEGMEYGPHATFEYPEDMNVMYDVNDLVIHYVKRQANIQKDEKRHAKRYLKRFIPELFNITPQELSDEEEVEEERDPDVKSDGPEENGQMAYAHTNEECQKMTACENPGTANCQSSNENDSPESSTYRLFYGANAWLIFIKLHHLMCDRLAFLKKKHREIIRNHEVEESIRLEREAVINKCSGNSASLKSVELDTKIGLPLLKPGNENPVNYYSALITEIKNLLDGIIDSVTFEDNVRKMFGTAAYLTFTMDKIIMTIARQIQNMQSEDMNSACMELYKKYRLEKPTNLYCHDKNEENINEAYERAAQELMVNQNCFKTVFCHENRTVAVELIDSVVTEEGERADGDQKWSSYVHHFVESLCDEPSSSTLNQDQQQILDSIAERPPLFLMRHIKAGMDKYRKKDEEASKKDEDENGEAKPEEKWPDVTVNEDLYIQFSPAGNYKMRFAKGSADVLIRLGAPGRGMDKHEAVTRRRKDRFLAWLEERLVDEAGDVLGPRNWLAEGSRIVPVRHPNYPYITYSRYYSNISSTSSNRS